VRIDVMFRSPEMLEPDSSSGFRADPITTGVTTGVRAGRLGGRVTEPPGLQQLSPEPDKGLASEKAS